MIRRIAFVLLFALNTTAAGAAGYAVNEYQHLKKDYEDLRVIARNTMMQLEQQQETTRACTTNFNSIKDKLFIPLEIMNANKPATTLAAGR